VACSQKIDLPAACAYTQVVYAAADAYIASLFVTDLSREIDMTNKGLGVNSLNWCLNALIASHPNNMAGEVSVMKGLQGPKDCPF
jgi:hypothetical protein